MNRRRERFMVVLWTGLVYLVTGVLTWSYPPDYLAFGHVWSVVFLVAGWTALMTLVYHKEWLAVLSGALLVGSAIFRSAAIFVELGWERWIGAFYHRAAPMEASFSIAGMTWLLIAVLLWVGWPQIQAHILSGGDDRDEQ